MVEEDPKGMSIYGYYTKGVLFRTQKNFIVTLCTGKSPHETVFLGRFLKVVVLQYNITWTQCTEHEPTALCPDIASEPEQDMSC